MVIEKITPRQTLLISLCLTALNLLNYIDRYTVISVAETHLKCPFRLTDTDIGRLQAFFFVTYMLFSPIVGHFGDMYSRKRIISFGVIIWVLGLFVGYSVDTPDMCAEEDFIRTNWYKLLISRAIFGTGETFYICLSTAILHDLYQNVNDRMKWMSYFCMMIPIGSGLGYICGDKLADKTDGNWQLATVAFTPLTILVLIFWSLLPDVPHRYSQLLEIQENGVESQECEKILNNSEDSEETNTNSLNKDSIASSSRNKNPEQNTKIVPCFDSSMKARSRRLISNKTYMLVLVAEVAVCWCCGAGSIHFPTMIQRAENLDIYMNSVEPQSLKVDNSSMFLDEKEYFEDYLYAETRSNETEDLLSNSFKSCNKEGRIYRCTQVDQSSSVMATFGAIVTAAGFVGAFLGGKLSVHWNNLTADTDASAISQFCAGIFTFLTIYLVTSSQYLYWTLLFLSFTGLNFIWPVYNNIILSVVDARDKCFATAAINLVSHALGDLISPVMVGKYSEQIQNLAIEVSPELNSTLQFGIGEYENMEFNPKAWAFIEFNSLQQALLLLPIVFMIAAVFFSLASRFYIKDKRRAEVSSAEI